VCKTEWTVMLDALDREIFVRSVRTNPRYSEVLGTDAGGFSSADQERLLSLMTPGMLIVQTPEKAHEHGVVIEGAVELGLRHPQPVQLLELLDGAALVGVVLDGELPICSLDVAEAGVLIHTKYLIQVRRRNCNDLLLLLLLLLLMVAIEPAGKHPRREQQKQCKRDGRHQCPAASHHARAFPRATRHKRTPPLSAQRLTPSKAR